MHLRTGRNHVRIGADGMTEKVLVEVMNVPPYALNYEYWVIFYNDGYLWYWSASDDENRALESLNERGEGMVIRNER